MGSGNGLQCFPSVFRISWLVVFVLFCAHLSAQAPYPKTPPAAPKPITPKKKVLFIPFEPKMYMSDIDHNINRETKMNFNEIRESFRKGLDKELTLQFKQSFSSVSLLRDTAKTNKDLQFILHSVTYKYTPTKGPEKVATPANISKGQLTAQNGDDEEKYMRTIVNQPGLFAAMNKKYGTELFIFISEIDFKGASAEGSPDREVDIHYSIYDKDGKFIYGNLAKAKFAKDMNQPKEIITKIFPVAVKDIYNHALPPAPAQGGTYKTGGK
jgi:hypothetical protein